MSDKDELAIPEGVERDPQSLEILRVWIANKKQHMTIKTNVWSDAAGWGIMLADLARNIASAHEQQFGVAREETLQRLTKGFDAEIAKKP